MEKYNLEQTGQEVQNILNEATTQSELTAETERAQLTEQQLQNDIDAIEEKIPSGASSSNKLATEEYVDDSVSTATATFRGTFNLVSDLGLTVDATEQQIAAALASEISTADNNDYCFVQIPTSAETPTEIEEIDRYKFNGTDWSFEYELNNSGFTADQWNAINSHITSGDVTKLLALPTNAELNILLNGKQDVLTFDNVPTENSNNPVKSGGVKSAIDDEKGARINSDTALQQAIDGINGKIPSDASSSNKLATASDVDDEATARSNADQSLQDAIEAILLLIPTAASSLNQLADKAFVNSSIATNTATFRGTFNLVNDLHLTLAATHAQVGNALALAIPDSDNNDYCFVQIPTVETAPNEIAQTDRYKFNGSTWEYEYTLNNSGFTSAQWIAINSGITSVLVSKLSELPTNSELTSELGALTTAINNINLKIPAAAAQNNKLVDIAALEAYIIQVLDVLTVTYNVTSSDGHVTFHIEQTDGKITAVTLTTNDIASANDLTVLAGRVTTAENDIDALEFRVGTNEADIALLQAAYAGLTQSDIIIGALPASGVANKIYRVPGTNSYSDYMWNGTQFVLMATYNNAIDPRPKKASQNLVTSGGIFDNMGALDISELNATENPHTLATYADLSAALAAIPSNDYKKGGMSIKFVQTDDNKYVQYRFMLSSFTDAQFATPSNWQGITNEISNNSKDLVQSGVVFSYIRNDTTYIRNAKILVKAPQASDGNNGDYAAVFYQYNNNRVYKKENGAWSEFTNYVRLVISTDNGRTFFKASNKQEVPFVESGIYFCKNAEIINSAPSGTGNAGDFKIRFNNNSYYGVYYYDVNNGWVSVDSFASFINNVVFVINNSFCHAVTNSYGNSSFEYITDLSELYTDVNNIKSTTIPQIQTSIGQLNTRIDGIDAGIKSRIVLKELRGTTDNSGISSHKFDIRVQPNKTYIVELKAQYTGSFSIYASTDGTDNLGEILSITQTDYSDGISAVFSTPANCYMLRNRFYNTGLIVNYIRIVENKDCINTNQWIGRVIACYGDSVTELNGDDAEYPYNPSSFTNEWALRMAYYFSLQKVYNRGIGGQRFSWMEHGGSVAWVTPDGHVIGRLDGVNYDNWDGTTYPTSVQNYINAGGTPVRVRGALSSWLRIISMFPASIKDSIDVVLVQAHNDAIYFDNTTNPVFIENDTTDPEWAASSYYSTYGGDYNISVSRGAMASTIMKLQAWMPNAKIIFMTPISGRWDVEGELNTGLTSVMQEVVEATKYIHNLMSIPLIDLYGNDGINGLNRTTYIADKIHPYTVAGSKVIASVIISYLKPFITPSML